MKIALFSTRIADVMFLQAAQATVHLLERLGHEVHFPGEQDRRGQMRVNMGYCPEAMSLIHNYVSTFTPVFDEQWDAIVAPLGSCTGSLQHQTSLVARDQGEPQLTVYAEAPVKRIYDLPELLINVFGMVDVDAYFPYRVTYHTTCRSLQMTRIGDIITRLIVAIRDANYMSLPDSDVCCGFGGTFSLKNPEVSAAILSDKMVNAISTGAEIVAADGHSCPVNVGGGPMRSGSGVRSMCLTEVPAGTEEPS